MKRDKHIHFTALLRSLPHLTQRFDIVHPEYFLFKEKHKMEDNCKYTVGRRRAGS
jgi:hypothetical protein